MRRPARRVILLGWLLAGLAGPAGAVQPDEVLPDPRLEQRARAISGGLRCLVCQNQSIDDSDAPLARDLRILVRERLRAGDDDGAVRSFLVERYGDFILLRPPVSPGTLLLWGGPILMVGGAAAGLWLAARRRDRRVDPLSADDRAALDRLLAEDHATASSATGFSAASSASIASAETGREIR